jgi:hypothetical protein
VKGVHVNRQRSTYSPIAFFTTATTASNAAGSSAAISDRLLRSSSMFAFSRPAMNWL